jgi:hypothetical protein
MSARINADIWRQVQKKKRTFKSRFLSTHLHVQGSYPIHCYPAHVSRNFSPAITRNGFYSIGSAGMTETQRWNNKSQHDWQLESSWKFCKLKNKKICIENNLWNENFAFLQNNKNLLWNRYKRPGTLHTKQNHYQKQANCFILRFIKEVFPGYCFNMKVRLLFKGEKSFFFC